ncbi:TonB-dependent receptor plug domain-containing protein [Hymenobacter sp. BT175]|uniref:TonB-dependent receptor plug domain-containing protein n=1 Tax=Hymenobacter translucens TaxID=2886507 RepID=UPI001D0ECFAC|nr:TonB-dependent receptor plug domain-containing protein [Hymenobacter translucens]MCC2547276.1 TonB-dependent receptor plug domain-containing protein [Hymenobacter translucens]
MPLPSAPGRSRVFRQFLLLLLLPMVGGTAAFRPAADEVVERILKSVVGFYQAALPEKAYLHLDKAFYATGETIWFKAYVVDAGQHRPDTLSKVLYVDLVSAGKQVVARRTLRLQNGLTHGDLALPDTLPAGSYLIRAYTNWMRNASPDFFYSRQLAIWPAGTAPAGTGTPVGKAGKRSAAVPAVAARTNVQFFPEGGTLVDELESVVGFKATDAYGRGVDVKGTLLDAQGKAVTTFSSHHLGMGSFRFTPAPGQRYRASVTLPGGTTAEYPLPAGQPSGYALRVVETNDFFTVIVRRRVPAGAAAGGNILLVSHVRGQLAFVGQGAVSGADPFVARVPKSRFPAGVVHFTVFDEQGQPQCERLAFALTEQPVRVTLTPDKPSYGPREAVQLTVSATDAAGKPVAARLSVAVADAGAGSAGESIASNLLLTSDLGGRVESPDYYFQENTPDVRQALNDLLLTQGWRRFVWKQVLAGQQPPRDFVLEQALNLGGQVTTPNQKPAGGSQLTFLQDRPEKLFLTATTDAEGRFLFRGFTGRDTARITLQARTAKGGRNLVIRLTDAPGAAGVVLAPLPPTPPAAVTDYVRRSQQQQSAERSFRLDTTKSTLLKGVTIQGKKQEEPTDPRRIYSLANATVVKPADFPQSSTFSILQLLQGRVPGVAITGQEPNMSIQIRGASSIEGDNSPVILLDGVPVTLDAIAYYPAADVESVEILKGGSAASFGGNGANGVIAILTRRGNPSYNYRKEATPGLLTLRMPGYYRAREFYAPRYEASAKAPRPDPRRTTLFWAPNVQTDATGRTQLTFYTADAGGTFQATAEGLTSNGQPGRGTGTVLVRDR